jgi:DNA-binding transcriptional ArsR family regulator
MSTSGSTDAVFQALAHPARRELDLLRAAPAACVGEVCEQFGLSRIGADIWVRPPRLRYPRALDEGVDLETSLDECNGHETDELGYH